MKQQNRLYVHCGFHKTGSTALQAALRASETPLRDAGFLYPYTGSGDKPGKEHADPHKHAHHNIAHEADRHWLFNDQQGTLDELEKELQNFSGNVILSSELFETMMTKPESFGFFRKLAQNLNKKLTIMIYLRNQISYAQSLYLELMNYEFGKEYVAYADEVLTHGAVKCRGLIHQFDYERALECWNDATDVDIMVRNYHALEGGSVITDFAQLFGLEEHLAARPGQEHLNVRETVFEPLQLFYRSRISRNLTSNEMARIKHLAQRYARLTSSATIQQKFAEKFQASNLRLCKKFGLPATGLDMQETLPPSAVTLEQFFSFETHCAIRSGVIPNTNFAPAETKNTDWMTGIETAVKNRSKSEMIRDRREQAAKAFRWYARRIKNLLPFMASLVFR